MGSSLTNSRDRLGLATPAKSLSLGDFLAQARNPSVLLVLASWAVLIVSLGHFLSRNSLWLRLERRDLVRWLRHPEVAGGWQGPAGWPEVVAFGILALAIGWLAAVITLRGTDLAKDWLARSGIALIFGVCVIGYAGVVAVTIGHLELVTLWLTLFALAIGSVLGLIAVWYHSKPNLSACAEPPRRKLPHILAVIGWPLAVFVGALSFAHAAFAPVTEWDAVVYHAAAAKLWFLSRPDPPLLYGPSVGIEISANYPPLFQATGAALYTVANSFADFYLRMISPILLVGLMLLTFAYARARFGRETAWWTLILLLGSPLIVLYAVWPTDYMLLAALTLLALILCQLAATSGSFRGWTAAGVVAGLAMLAHFYGWLTLGFGLVAVIIWQRSWRGVLGLAIFGMAALLTASPWLIRNLALLHDPVYPLGAPLFHGMGLIQPLWQATQDEVKRNALGQFGSAHGLRLRLTEVAGILGSHFLLPTGLLLGLLMGIWRASKGDRVAGYLAAALLVPIGAYLTPGWYWLRALLQVVPIAAMLAGLTIGDITRVLQRANLGWPTVVARGLWAPTLAAVILTSSVAGSALALDGPNQDAWTQNLDGSHDVLRAVRNLGSYQQQVWTVYGGDYLCWQWLNEKLAPEDKVATLDVRLYYMERPQNIFYLDGREAVPLLHMRSPQEVRRYLTEQGVRYIMIPAWAVAPTPSRHPAADLLPLMGMLGKPDGFPLTALFAPTGGPWPTSVYSLSGLQVPVAPALWPGSGAPIPSPAQEALAVRHDQTDARIYAPILSGAQPTLGFTYYDGSPGMFELNVYDFASQRWHYQLFRAYRSGTGEWVKATVPLPTGLAEHLPGLGFVLLGVYSAHSDLDLRDLTVVQAR
jgi:hypothetical protein